MRTGLAALLVVSGLCADLPAQAPEQRCEVVERIDLTGGADLLFRDRNFRLYRCFGDLEDLKQANIRAGDVVDWSPGFDGSGRCRIATLRFVGRAYEPNRRPRMRLDLNPLNTVIRRGNVMYGGVIAYIDGEYLEVRTTRGERIRAQLRDDTHYFQDGLPSAFGELVLNQVVSIRAGRNFEGQLEAFYVMWGDILRPQEER